MRNVKASVNKKLYKKCCEAFKSGGIEAVKVVLRTMFKEEGVTAIIEGKWLS